MFPRRTLNADSLLLLVTSLARSRILPFHLAPHVSALRLARFPASFLPLRQPERERRIQR